MKHSYLPTCQCARCSKERARRNQQGRSTIAVRTIHKAIEHASRHRGDRHYHDRESYPIGSQQWAETRSDDFGPSEDC